MATTLEVLNASQLSMLLNPPMVNLENTAFSLTSNATAYFAITMATQHSKSGNITWSNVTNPSRVTAVVPGTYLVTGTILWPLGPPGLGTNDGRAQAQINGTATDVRFNTIRGSAGNSASVCAGLLVLNAGDFLEIAANQNTGTAFNIVASLGVNLVSLATS